MPQRNKPSASIERTQTFSNSHQDAYPESFESDTTELQQSVNASAQRSPNVRVTAGNILALQRTVGNRVVQQLLQQQRATAEARRQPAEKKAESSPSTHNGVAANTIMRLPSVETLTQRGNVESLKKMSTKHFLHMNIFNKIDDYNALDVMKRRLPTNKANRQADADIIKQHLDDMQKIVQSYLNLHRNSKKYRQNVDSFRIFNREIDFEKMFVKKIVDNKRHDSENGGPTIKWKRAICSAPRILDTWQREC